MSNEIKFIPELRFPEFLKERAWKLENVDSLFDLQDGYAFPSGVFTSQTENARQVIRITDINNHNKNSEKVFIPKEKIDDLGIDNYAVKKGDLLLSLTGAAGFNFYIWESDEAFINQRTLRISPKDSKNEPLKILLSPLIHEIINGIGTGQNNNLSKDALKAIEFPVPQNPKEQQKIASCLSSLDELIAAHNEKLETLKDHKKGLMQNLFPQEGQHVPNYRFPEFEKDGEWVEKELEKVCEVNPRVSELPDEFVYVDLESVSDGLLLKRNFIKKKGAPSRAQRLLQNKDVIYQMVRPYQKNNYYFIKSDGYEYVASTGYAQLRAFNSSKFLFQLIHTDRFVSSILDNCTGSNYPAINSSALKQTKVQIPPTKIEQQKIASCLSALDELITAQAEKIEQLQQHKKGLMQGLFPKIDK